MPGTMIIVFAVVLFLHGLLHLMGTVVYMKLGTIETLPYKTTLLGGRWDPGEDGMMVFGALWLLAAAGFVVSAVSLLSGWSSAHQLLLGVTLLSLLLTSLDWNVAYAGIVINLFILIAELVRPGTAE